MTATAPLVSGASVRITSAASMSVSIVRGNRLWGLIACHNYSPRYIAADQRIACELFAQIFSLQLEARLQAEIARLEPQARRAASLDRDLERARKVMSHPIMFDGRNLFDPREMERLGYIYKGIGRS